MYYVVEVRTCKECNGNGYIYDPQCQHNGCHRRYSSEELASLSWEDGLPCGHDFMELQEEHPCIECEGKGEITREVPLKEALLNLEVINEG